MSKQTLGKKIKAIRARAKVARQIATINGGDAGIKVALWRGSVGREIGAAIKVLLPAQEAVKVADLRLIKEGANEQINAIYETHAASAINARAIAGDCISAFYLFMRGDGVKTVASVEIKSAADCDAAIKPFMEVVRAEVAGIKASKASAAISGKVAENTHANEIKARVAEILN
jgi:hypothetical protein